MKKNRIFISIDLIGYLLNDLSGWFIVIIFDVTGEDCKFQDIAFHRLMLIFGIIHIIASILCSLFFFGKERTKYHIQIGKKLLVYNLIMTLFPYLYLLIVLT